MSKSSSSKKSSANTVLIVHLIYSSNKCLFIYLYKRTPHNIGTLKVLILKINLFSSVDVRTLSSAA